MIQLGEESLTGGGKINPIRVCINSIFPPWKRTSFKKTLPCKKTTSKEQDLTTQTWICLYKVILYFLPSRKSPSFTTIRDTNCFWTFFQASKKQIPGKGYTQPGFNHWIFLLQSKTIRKQIPFPYHQRDVGIYLPHLTVEFYGFHVGKYTLRPHGCYEMSFLFFQSQSHVES